MRILIVAGEVSGEIYGARLMREIKRIAPRAKFAGIGGDRMKQEGLDLYYHCRDMASIGVVEMVGKIGFLLDALNGIRDRIKAKEFDAIIVIDYPGFNFRVARAGHESGVPVFYYVLPHVWAWRRYRVHALRRWVDTLLAALPFEEEFYASLGVRANFVGHPMLDEICPARDGAALRAELTPPGCSRLIGILPGSRTREVADMVGPLVATADIVRRAIPDAGFVIPAAPHISLESIKAAVGGRTFINVVAGRSHDVMAASDLLITKSGTSSLEAALFGTPMIIVYRSSHVSFWLAKLLVRVKYAGLPNIIAGREVAKEFLQNRFTPENVARHAVELLSDPSAMDTARKEMGSVCQMLGTRGAAERAAAIIVDRLRRIDPELVGGDVEPGYF